MAMSIRNSEVEDLARQLAIAAGATMSDVILGALRELKVVREGRGLVRLEKVRSLVADCSALPVLDARSADEILGYDSHGGF